jgi:hypothetical protein
MCFLVCSCTKCISGHGKPGLARNLRAWASPSMAMGRPSAEDLGPIEGVGPRLEKCVISEEALLEAH